jgi:hypothetical protein
MTYLLCSGTMLEHRLIAIYMKKRILVSCKCEGTGFIAVADCPSSDDSSKCHAPIWACPLIPTCELAMKSCVSRTRCRQMAGRNGGAVAGYRTWVNDVRPDWFDAGIEPSRRTRVRPVAQGSSLGKTETETRRVTNSSCPQNAQRRLAEYNR